VCRRLLPNGSRLAGYPLALDLSTVLEVLHRLDKADLLEMLEGAENRHLKYLLNRSAISASLGRSYPSDCWRPFSELRCLRLEEDATRDSSPISRSQARCDLYQHVC